MRLRGESGARDFGPCWFASPLCDENELFVREPPNTKLRRRKFCCFWEAAFFFFGGQRSVRAGLFVHVAPRTSAYGSRLPSIMSGRGDTLETPQNTHTSKSNKYQPNRNQSLQHLKKIIRSHTTTAITMN